VLTDSSVYITGERSNVPSVLGLDRATGRIVWERPVETTRREPRARRTSGARPTPTTEGLQGYAFFPDFGLVSFDAAGRHRWSTPLGPFASGWGMATSPILVDNQVIVQADGYAGSFIAAFDTATGRDIWRRDRPAFLQNYSTPIVRSAQDGTTEILALAPNQIVAYASRTGAERWTAPAPGQSIVSSLAIKDDLLFCTNHSEDAVPSFAERLKQSDRDSDGRLGPGEFGTDQLAIVYEQVAKHTGDKDGRLSEQEFLEAYRALGADQSADGKLTAHQSVVAAIRLQSSADGTIRGTTAWTYARNAPYAPSPLVYDGTLYLLAAGGILTTISDMTSPDTSKVARVDPAFGNCWASPVAAGGKVFVLSEDGKAGVLKAGAAWQLLSMEELNETCYATPALAGGRVYLRTSQSVMCFASVKG
jgi:outer membrane protein assembly factor BamB